MADPTTAASAKAADRRSDSKGSDRRGSSRDERRATGGTLTYCHIRQLMNSRLSLLVLVNLAIFVTLAVLRPESFFNWMNIKAVMSLMTYDLLLAVGMTLVLILGGLDLSVGGVLALTSVVMALMMRGDIPVVWGLSAGFGVAVICGAVNGILVEKAGILPFLVTLGTMAITRGLATVATSGQYISFPMASAWFLDFGHAEIPLWHSSTGMTYGFPVPLLLVFIVISVVGWLMRNWRPFAQMFLVGENVATARLSGLSVAKLTISGYIICSLFAWLAAVLMISSNRIGYANYGVQSELRALAAAVVGGASMAGGAGSIWGTFLGVLLLALIGNGFVLLNGNPNWQQACVGLVLVAAVGIDALRTIKARRS